MRLVNWFFALVILAIFLTGVTVWLVPDAGARLAEEAARVTRTEPTPTEGRNPTRAEIATLQAEAGRACRCARRLAAGDDGRSACWRDFDRDLARFEHTVVSSMCLPLSPQLVCFDDGSNNCFVKDHDGGACTDEEARTLEAIWSRRARDDQASLDRAGREMDRAVQAFIRGERVQAPHSSGGCSG